jgi:cardiolipin synthase
MAQRKRTQAHELEGRRVIHGNSVTLLVDGEDAFPAMLQAIGEARRSIVLASYIFAQDKTGERFRDALVESALRGVEVRVTIDGVGSFGTHDSFFQPLVAAGGHFSVFRRPLFWRPRWTLRQRDHRKILVVDDRLGFVGGMNIGDDYASEDWGGRAWHDMHARIEGPAARELTLMFNRTWRRLEGESWNAQLGPAVECGSVPVQVLESRFRQRFLIHRAYLGAIRRAQSSVHITNAYFIPVQSVQRALRYARRRGVQVQLLLAGRTDVRAVQYAARALYASLFKSGIEIYEWNERVLHAKCAVIDGHWCSVGSYNLNRRSLLHDLEANMVCLDAELGEALETHFTADIARSQRVDPDTWHRRPAHEKLLEQLFYKLRVFL